MAPELETEVTKVRGCASQVWLVSEIQGAGTMHFVGDSDAHIVRRPHRHSVQDLRRQEPRANSWPSIRRVTFAALGLNDHLTPQRSNGLASMVEARSRRRARRCGPHPLTPLTPRRKPRRRCPDDSRRRPNGERALRRAVPPSSPSRIRP